MNTYFGKHVPKLIKTLSSIGLSILLILPAIQAARSDESPATARKLSASGQILSLEKITKAAKALKPGEILETELERKHGIYVYEVEILDDKGLVWELKLNAKTGKLIKMEQDD